MLARARQIRLPYIIMHGPTSLTAVGISEFQQVKPILFKPTGNFLNSVAVKVVCALFLQQVKCLNRAADVKKDNDQLLTMQKLGRGHLLQDD
ncbi:hypothetical protein VULLAG_LOCUS5669 [Vulpes lagopus]